MLKPRWSFVAVVAPLVVLVTYPAAAAFGSNPLFHVVSVEVNQGVQRVAPAEAIPLIAQRSFAVRVQLAADAPTTVLASMRVAVNGVIAKVVEADNHPFTIPGAIAVEEERATLNFLVPPGTGIRDQDAVELVFELRPVDCGPTVTHEHDAGVAVEPLPLRVYFVPVDYTPARKGPPCFSLIGMGTGDAYVRGALPVDDSDAELYLLGGAFEYDENDDQNGDGILDRDEDDALIEKLEDWRQQWVAGVPAQLAERTFVYGWLRDDPIEGHGWSSSGGRVAYGNSDPIRHQRTLAHEIGHLLGFGHEGLKASEVGVAGMDTAGRLHRNPLANAVAEAQARVKKPSAKPIMLPGHFTADAWIHPDEFECMLQKSACKSGLGEGTSGALTDASLAEEVAFIRGWIAPDARSVRLGHVFRYQWAAAPSPPRDDGAFELIVYYSQDDPEVEARVSRRFDATEYRDAPGFPERPGFFSLAMPVPAGRQMTRIEVRAARGDFVLGSFDVPEGQPGIEIVSVAPFVDTVGQFEVTIELAHDALHPRDMRYQIAYQPNPSGPWYPIASGVQSDQRIVTIGARPAWLPQEASNGILAIHASDGRRTGYAEQPVKFVPP